MGMLRVSVMVVLTAAVVQLLPGFIGNPEPLEMIGTVEKGWEPVAEAFRKVMASQPKYGYGYSVYHKGKKVVDLYGGYADYSTKEPYRENTLTQLFSSTKGLCAICIAMLVDRGLLDYSKPVSQYWPEFAANGKKAITVETLLSHQAGLYDIEDFDYFDIVNNPELISKKLAEQKPLWEPGKFHGYHGITIAMYMNEIVKRVDPKHRNIETFFKEELADPLDLDIHIGLPLEENYRTALSLQTVSDGAEDLLSFIGDNAWLPLWLVMTGGRLKSQMLMFKGIETNNPYTRAVPCGSMSGYGTAKDSARLMGMLAAGGTDQDRVYLSPEAVRQLETLLVSGRDEVLTINMSFGYGTTPVKSPLGSMMFGTPGAGGQLVYGDTEYQLGYAFVTNKRYTGFNTLTPQNIAMVDATYQVLKNIKS